MGYCMKQIDSKFHIKKQNFALVLTAIRNLRGKETIKDSSGSHFSWVVQDFHTNDNPFDMFRAWRWNISTDENGDICSIRFTGEKWGDDFLLFQAIAPYVEPGSYIEMEGEDNAVWIWDFRNNTCVEKSKNYTRGGVKTNKQLILDVFNDFYEIHGASPNIKELFRKFVENQ